MTSCRLITDNFPSLIFAESRVVISASRFLTGSAILSASLKKSSVHESKLKVPSKIVTRPIWDRFVPKVRVEA